MDKLKIFLTKGYGKGVTKQGAYCQALEQAGLINLNLIKLSSVLPHNCEIIDKKPQFSNDDYGKKLYVILSEVRTSKVNESVCAGVGWMLEVGGKGNGLVIQIEGKNKKEVEGKINLSLDEIAKSSNRKYEKVRIVTKEIICREKSVCSLVALVFKLEGWD